MENETLITYLGCSVVSLIILYYIIKSAVKNGYLEARKEEKSNDLIRSRIAAAETNEELNRLLSAMPNNGLSKTAYLQNLYDNDKITKEQHSAYMHIIR